MRQKRGNYTTLDEYVFEKTGKNPVELNNYKSAYQINKLDKAAEMVTRYASAQLPIIIFADYDVDGFTSATQWIQLMSYQS